MATVALVGTLDTKGPDYAFLAGRLRASGAGVIVVDAGTGTPAGITPDIPAEQVAAAAAMAGMALARAGEQSGEQASDQASGDDERPLVAASMFGVTTPAVETARSRLTGLGYEVLVFHATGAGGRALEALAEARLLAGVLDVTTTELADDLVGGVLSDRAAGLHPAPGRRLRRLDAVTRIAVARHSNVLTRRPGRADRRRYGGPAVAVAPQGYFWSTLMWNLTWLSFTEVTVSVRPSLVPSLARSWHRILVPSTAFRSPGQVIDFGRWPTVLVSSLTSGMARIPLPTSSPCRQLVSPTKEATKRSPGRR